MTPIMPSTGAPLTTARWLSPRTLQVHNLTRASAASLRQGVAELQAQVESLQGRLEDRLSQFEGAREEVACLEGLVVDEVSAHNREAWAGAGAGTGARGWALGWS